MTVAFMLNGRSVTVNVEPERRLVDILREDFELTRTKAGCYAGDCGACTVLLNGALAVSCMLPAFALRGASVLTIDGFSRTRDYGDILRSFNEAGYAPCGYCAQGRILSVHVLLEKHAEPSEEQILSGLAGIGCQCADYSTLLRAVSLAASARKSRRRARR